MCILKEVGRFIKNGASTFRDASQGRYRQNSDAVSEFERRSWKKIETELTIKRTLWETGRMSRAMFAGLLKRLF